jgi:hypothetical protein
LGAIGLTLCAGLDLKRGWTRQGKRQFNDRKL